MTTEFETIFDGTDLTGWVHIGPGHFESEPDGSIRSVGGMGLLWYTASSYRDFALQVEYKSEQAKSNSGVFVRFPEPREDPWNPVHEGHEIQICDTPTEPKHRTGAIYDIKGATHVPTKTPGEWNLMEIEVVGQHYKVSINSQLVCEHTSDRSLEGYIGLQNHGDGDTVWFRSVRVKSL